MVFLTLMLVLAGCSDPQPLPEPSSPSILPPGGAEPVQPEPGAPAETEQTPDPLRLLPPVQRALADLAGRLDIPASEIGVQAVEEVTWPDSGLGCGQPGMAYLQVLTPGYRVVLAAAGGQYVYHLDNKQTVVLCKEDIVDQKPGEPGAVETGLQPFVDQAVADLVSRLGVRIEEVEVLEAKSMVWPNAGMGCPQPDMRYKQVPEEGYLIRLVVEKQVYAYHGGGGKAPFLCEQLSKDPSKAPQIDITNLTSPAPGNSIPPGEDQ